jgi:hypothetical protein
MELGNKRHCVLDHDLLINHEQSKLYPLEAVGKVMGTRWMFD